MMPKGSSSGIGSTLTMIVIEGLVNDIKKQDSHNIVTLTSGIHENHIKLSCRSIQGVKIKIGDYLKLIVEDKDQIIGYDSVLLHYSTTKAYYFENSLHDNLLRYSTVKRCIRQVLQDWGFLEINLPSIHYGETKGDTFNLDFFGRKARLSSSNALHITVASSYLGKIYSIQRVFRAEPSRTSKHLSEFDLLEIGMIGCNLEDLVQFTKELLLAITIHVSSFYDLSKKKVQIKEIQDFNYTDIDTIYNLKGKGLGKYERAIAQELPSAIWYFPKDISTWAAKLYDKDHSHSFNILLPGVGEVAEGSIRNTDDVSLKAKFAQLCLSRQLDWICDQSSFINHDVGTVGLGLERLTMWLFSLTNIRDMCFYYRDMRFSEIKDI